MDNRLWRKETQNLPMRSKSYHWEIRLLNHEAYFIHLFKDYKYEKTNWKSVLLYIIRIVELVITGAAGGAASGWIGWEPSRWLSCIALPIGRAALYGWWTSTICIALSAGKAADITLSSRPMVRSRPVGPLNKWALTVRTTIGTVSGFAISEDSPTMERLPWIPERKPNEKPYRVCFVNCISDSPKP